MFGSKEEKVDLKAFYKALAAAETAQEEITRLRAQVDRLQEALVAATAAKAYESMQAAKYNVEVALTPEQKEKVKQRQDEGEFLARFAEYQEKPLFTDADEMIFNLGKNVGYNIGDDPVQPGNSES